MAFVCEEPRRFNFNQAKDVNEVGPGQYLPVDDYRSPRQYPAPFKTSSLKLSDKANDNPGPGSYNIDKTLNQFSKLKRGEKVIVIKKLNQLQQSQAHTTSNHAKDPHSNQRRLCSLNEKAKEATLLPEDKPNKSIDEVKAIPKKRKPYTIKKGQLRGYLNKIPSIPQKGFCGFTIQDSECFIQKDPPEKFSHFSGVNGDTVGPGSYNIDLPDEWHQTGTNWSKMKAPRLHRKAKHSHSVNSFKFLADNEINIHDFHKDNEQMQKSVMNFSKISLKKLIKNYLDSKAKESQPMPMLKSNKDNGNPPGPGYYFNINLHSSFKPLSHYEGGIIFGSKMDRFSKLSFDKEDYSSPGPASYFINRRSKPITLIPNKKKAKEPVKPFYSNTSRFHSTKPSFFIPGPGTYDYQSSISSKNFSKSSTAFYAHQKRFIETIQEEENKKQIPGPGAYIDPFMESRSSLMFETSDKSGYCPRNKELHSQKSETTYKTFASKKDIGASVGQYNGDYSLSIEYNNLKKFLNNKTEVAFNSTCPRKKNEEAANAGVGPGSYFNHSFIGFHQRLIPFNYSTSRMSLMKKSRSVVNVIEQNSKKDYNNDSAWLKKTYNIKYL